MNGRIVGFDLTMLAMALTVFAMMPVYHRVIYMRGSEEEKARTWRWVSRRILALVWGMLLVFVIAFDVANWT